MFEAEVYANAFFTGAGFLRKQCPSGAWFWTLDPDRVYSGDQEGVLAIEDLFADEGVFHTLL
ncbi:MAG: hypothetical protein AAFX99_22415, partial [Myxococcota bacterium]